MFLFSLPSVHFPFPIWRFPTQCTYNSWHPSRDAILPIFWAVSCGGELLVIASLIIYEKISGNCISDNLDAHEKEEGVGGWERGFFICTIYIVPF